MRPFLYFWRCWGKTHSLFNQIIREDERYLPRSTVLSETRLGDLNELLFHRSHGGANLMGLVLCSLNYIGTKVIWRGRLESKEGYYRLRRVVCALSDILRCQTQALMRFSFGNFLHSVTDMHQVMDSFAHCPCCTGMCEV